MLDTAAAARLLADPTRVRLLDALTAGPLRTSELAAAASMSAAAVSRHLQLLRDGDVVERLDVADDGRGRAYRLRPAALEHLADWIRSTTWSAELTAAVSHPRTRELVGRIGGFLDALTDSDVSFFERHLGEEAVLIFPGLAEPIDKRGCIQSVSSHPPYQRHQLLAEPTVQLLGTATTVITLHAEVGTAVDDHPRHTFITAVMEERDPWQLAHLQWTPAAPPDQKGITDD
ncbi:metalloregulator ArsR/SmtB family transcription factor [Pseudofrankia sp. BMG5.37]|uniref:ArsR/SmtB family transcription factor n=1 Tax=Pseudofrankia sp. BMG5.37 TaxID=3050035 RepID=UPI00289582EE|nr:metalloregulator ArsR/SmtB family transcription factor [Pseudofrankia sp. BMG5.37]MDT3444160.1 metalloregulator ArsR/SmtB family transcription factor [Pseudofrankia sp. BMG5.37]